MDNAQNPLRMLPPLTRRPSSSLSSAIFEPEDYLDLKEKAERRLDLYKPMTDHGDTATLLTIAMSCLPKQGRQNLMFDIVEQRDDVSVKQLRDHFVNAILKPMKASGGRTPVVTQSPSRGSEHSVQLQMSQITPSGRDDQKWLKEECLKRDDYCCVLSGATDLNSAAKYRNKYPSRQMRTGRTECAHILPFALGNFDESESLQVENKAIIWEALYRYFPKLKGLISPDRINIPENAITLWEPAHTSFGSLDIGLAKTDDPYTYRIDSFHTYQLAWNHPQSITFNAADPSVPLPDPILLQAHYSIAKILKVSGVGDEIDNLIYKSSVENIEPDGSSDIASMICLRLLMQV